MYYCKFLKAASLGVALSAILAGDLTAQGNRVFGLGQPSSIDELPDGQFRDTLRALPPQARGRAIGLLRELNTPEQDFKDMRVDKRGAILYVDPVIEEAGEYLEEPSLPEGITEANVFILHSKPGAAKTLYLDFDGHDLTGTVWNGYSGQSTLYMRPFSLDGDYASFSATEIARIAESWRRVAEDFAPFDVDVTTEEPAVFNSNVGHNLITNQQDAYGYWVYTQGGCGCGGVAYVNVFGNSYYQPGLSFNSGIGSNAMTISHETGHNLGLSHDGTSTKGYYSGHGSGETSWGPIMGAPFGKSVVQWSRAEYPDANNNEDDFARINNHLPFRSDDHADLTLGAATPLVVTGNVNVVSGARVTDPSWSNLANKGVINNRNDVDLFSMNVGDGTINLSIDPAIYEVYEGNQGADLDIEANLLDEFGTVLQTSNPDLQLGADINYAVTAGVYYLEITGVGRAGSTGYSDYGSVGQYYINGTVPSGGVVIVPPTAPSNLSVSLFNDVDVDLDWTDPLSTPESNETGYRVFRAVDGGAFAQIASLPADSNAYNDNNLSPGDYAYMLEVFNSAGADQTVAPHPTVTIAEPPSSGIAVATSESTALGLIVSGSYVNTQVASGSETLSEQHSGGRPDRRRSYLDHSWYVTGVTPGAMVDIVIHAEAPANSELDDFEFSYAIAGGPSGVIGTVINGGGLQELTASLPPDTNGTVEINVVDTDQNTQGNAATDSVIIHDIAITSVGDPDNLPPNVTITSPSDGANVSDLATVIFEATALDAEDGDRSGTLTWVSDLDNSIGSGGSFSTSLLSIGTHTVTASATDSAAQEGSDQVTITIYDSSGPSSMHVGDLDGIGAPAGKGGKWSAAVTVTVHDNAHNPVTGVTVSGSWSGGASGSGSCPTDGSGICTISEGGLKGNVNSATFTVTNVSGSATYVQGSNHDPDSDSNGTTITVAKP